MVHRSGSTLIIAPTTNDSDKDEKLCEPSNVSTKSSSSSTSATSNIKKDIKQKNPNLSSKTTTQRRKSIKEIPDILETNRQSINEKTPTKSLPLNTAVTTSTTTFNSNLTPIRRGRSYSVVTPTTETKQQHTNKKTQSIKNLNSNKTSPPLIYKNRNSSIDRESTTSTSSSSSTITTTISNIEKETSSSCSSLSSSVTSSSITKNTITTISPPSITTTNIRSALRSNSLERSPDKTTKSLNLAGLKKLNKKKIITNKKNLNQNDECNNSDDSDEIDIKSIKKCKSVESIFDNFNNCSDNDFKNVKTDKINFDQLPKLKLKCSVPLERISGILNSLNFNKTNKVNITEIEDSGGGGGGVCGDGLTITGSYDDDYNNDDEEDDDEDFEKDVSNSHNSLNSSNNSPTPVTNSIKINNQSQQQKSLCLYCDKKFSSHKIRITHTERVHKIAKGRRISSRTSLLSSSSNINLISTGGAIQLHSGCSYCCKNNNNNNNINNNSNNNSTTSNILNNNNSNHKKQENLSKITTISNDLKSLFNHMCDYHSDKYFACKECAIRFQNLEQLNEHNDLCHTDKSSTTILGKNRLKRNLVATTSSNLIDGSIKLENEISDCKLNQLLTIDTGTYLKNDTSNIDGNDNDGDIENTPTKTRRQLKQAMENHRPNTIVSITSATTTTLLTRSAASLLQQNVFRGVGDDTTILSRLGVVQNRLPRGRKGAIRNRNTRQTLTDTIKQDIVPQLTVKTRSKVGFCKLTSNEPTTIILPETVLSRQPSNNRTEPVSCTFDEDFYETVSLNVRKNLSCHLDGKLDCSPTAPSPISPVTTIPTICSTLVKSLSASDSEIHEATALTAITAFPTLLTAEQFGSDLQSASKIKRPITRHSWKWKWDSVKKYKYVNEGGKIVKKIKQPITGLRDLSKLDMWTQLTMRTKHELKHKHLDQSNTTISQFVTTTTTSQDIITGIGEQARETKRKQINQLNMILDERRLPQIILEQNEQTIIKIEPGENNSEEIMNLENCISTTQFQIISKNENDMAETSSNEISTENVNSEDNFPQMLNLFRRNRPQITKNENIILSGEWARPRFYICYGCGAKFDKLKTLEEHKMFRHPYVYSTHYEIVGRELIAGDLYKHFYIPTKALNRFGIKNLLTPIKSITKYEDGSKLTSIVATPSSACGEDESMDSVQSVSHRSLSVASKSDCDTDSKATTTTSSISRSSTYMSTRSSTAINLEDSNNCSNVLTSVNNGDMLRNCSKCKRECGGLLELYRHLLDCSGDYAWILAKKKKYRYFGVKRRRTAKQSERKKKSSNHSSTEESGGPPKPKYIYNPLAPRPPRPSDAESIRRMLENLPAKRACRKLIPEITNKPRNNKNLSLKKSILVKKGRKGGIGISSNIVNAKKLKNKLSTPSTVKGISKNILRNHKKQILTRHLRDLSRNKKENTKNSLSLVKQAKNEEKPDSNKIISTTADENNKTEESKKAAENFTKKTKRFVKNITQKLKPKKKNFTLKKIATRSSVGNLNTDISSETKRNLKDGNSSIIQHKIGEKDLQVKLKKLSKTDTLLRKLNFRKKNVKTPEKLEKNLDINNDQKREKDSENLNDKIPELTTEQCGKKLDSSKQKGKKIKKILNKFSNKNKNSTEDLDNNFKNAENLELKSNITNDDLPSNEKISKNISTDKDAQCSSIKKLSSTEDLTETKAANEELQQDSSTNFETSPTTKRRSKKLNDCIAMLTGKLQEKLGKSFVDKKNAQQSTVESIEPTDSNLSSTQSINTDLDKKNIVTSNVENIAVVSSLKNNPNNPNCDKITNSNDLLNQPIKNAESFNLVKKNPKRKSTTRKFIQEDNLSESLHSLATNANKIDLIENEDVTKVVSEISKSLENIKEMSKGIKETLQKPISTSCSNLTNINSIEIQKSQSQITTSRRSTRSKPILQITQSHQPPVVPQFINETQQLQNFELPPPIVAYPLKVPEHFNTLMTKNVNEIILQKGNKLSNDLIISPILPATNQIQFNDKNVLLPSSPQMSPQCYHQNQVQLGIVSTNPTTKKTLTAAQKKALPTLPIQPLPQQKQQILLQKPAPHIVQHSPIKLQNQTAPPVEQFAIDLSISQQRSTEATLLSFMDFDDAPLDLSKKSSTSLPTTPVTTPQMIRRTRNSTKPQNISQTLVQNQPQLVPENLSLNLKPIEISSNLPTINTLPIRIPTVCSPVMKNLTSLLMSPPLQQQQQQQQQHTQQLPPKFNDELLKNKLFELNAINHRTITELNIPNTSNLTTTNSKKKRYNANIRQQFCSKNSADKIDDTITSVILGLDLQNNIKEKIPTPLPKMMTNHNIIEIIKIPPPPPPRKEMQYKSNAEKPIPFHIPIHYNIPIESLSNKKSTVEIASITKKSIENQIQLPQKLNENNIISIIQPTEINKNLEKLSDVEKLSDEVEDIEALISRIHHIAPKNDPNKIDNVQSNEIGSTNNTGPIGKSIKRKPLTRKKKNNLNSDNKNLEVEFGKEDNKCDESISVKNLISQPSEISEPDSSKCEEKTTKGSKKSLAKLRETEEDEDQHENHESETINKSPKINNKIKELSKDTKELSKRDSISPAKINETFDATTPPKYKKDSLSSDKIIETIDVNSSPKYKKDSDSPEKITENSSKYKKSKKIQISQNQVEESSEIISKSTNNNIVAKLRKTSRLLESAEVKTTCEENILEGDENITKKVTRNSSGSIEKLLDLDSPNRVNKKDKKKTSNIEILKQSKAVEIENSENNIKKSNKKIPKNKDDVKKLLNKDSNSSEKVVETCNTTPSNYKKGSYSPENMLKYEGEEKDTAQDKNKKMSVKFKKTAKKLFEEQSENEENFNTKNGSKNSEKSIISKNITDDLNNKKITKPDFKEENCTEKINENVVQARKKLTENKLEKCSIKTSTPISKNIPKTKKLSRADAEIIENSFKDIQPIMNLTNTSTKDKISTTITKAERKSFNDKSFLLETVDISPVLSSTRRSNRNRSQINEIPVRKEVEAIAASFLSDDEDDNKPLISSNNKKSNQILKAQSGIKETIPTAQSEGNIEKIQILKKRGKIQETQNKCAIPAADSMAVSKNVENKISKNNIPEIEKSKNIDNLTNSLRKPQRGRKRKTSEPSEEIVTSEKENLSTEIDDISQSKPIATTNNNDNSDIIKQSHQISEELRPDSVTKKQRRRRRNELAAIVADQLLESFKEVDKSRLDDLKMLENLAYEKSEDLLLTGMRLTPTTKRKNALAENKEILKTIEQLKLVKPSIAKGKNNKSEKLIEKSEILELDNLKKKNNISVINNEKNSKTKSNENHKNQLKSSDPSSSNNDEQKSGEPQNACNFKSNSFASFRSIRDFGSSNTAIATDDKIHIETTVEPTTNKLLPILIETSNSVDSFHFQNGKQNNIENSEKSSKISLHKKHKKSKKKEKKVELENINELRSGLESFTFGKGQLECNLIQNIFVENDKKRITFSQIKEKSVNSINKCRRSTSPSKETIIDLIESDNLQKSFDKNTNIGFLKKPILRPSILTVTLESAVIKPTDNITTNSKEMSKTVSSRDPRLNKNKIIQQEAAEAMQLKRKSDKQNPDYESDCEELNNAFNGTRELRLRSSKRLNSLKGPNGSNFKAIGGNESSSDDDNYLAEIAKSVKDKIRGNQDEDFNLANDGFELAKSFLNDIPRPSTSLSMRSAPNFHDDRNNDFDYDENTNTELIDMDLDDDCSVYTSFSQDVRRKGRRRRRRSILMTRRRNSRASSVAPDSNEIFECQLCKKSFKKSQALTKHKMTLSHVSKLSAYEYFNLNATRKQQEEDEKKKKENVMAELQKKRIEEEKREAEMEAEKEKQRKAEDDLLKRKERMEIELKQRQEHEKQLRLEAELRHKEELKKQLEVEMRQKEEQKRKMETEMRRKEEQKRKIEAEIRQQEEEKRKLEEENRLKNEKKIIEISDADVKEVENAVLSIQPEICSTDNLTVDCPDDESSTSFSSSSSSSTSSEDLENSNSQTQQENQNQTKSTKMPEKHLSIPPPTISSLLNQPGIEPISSPEQNYDRYPNTTSSSRVALNPEERLFYECCNMLKGSETPMIERSYPIIQPTAYASFDLPNKPITPKSSERFSYLDGNFHPSAAYTVKSPLSQSRTSPRHAYPKIDVNQFSDISSDSNSGCPKAQPPPNLTNINFTESKKYSVFNQSPTRDIMANQVPTSISTSEGFKAVNILTGNVTNKNYPSHHISIGDVNFTPVQQYPGDIGAPNSIPLTARTFITNNQIKYGNNLSTPVDQNQQANAFTSPAHSTSSQGSTQTTTTTCRMKTKAAMKGYDNFKISIPTVGLDMQQALERSPQSSGCKLTALAEIALGNEPPSLINSTAKLTTTTSSIILSTTTKIDEKNIEENDRDTKKTKSTTINEEFTKKYQNMILNNTKNLNKTVDDKNTTAGKLGFKAKKNKIRAAKLNQQDQTATGKKLNVAGTVQTKDIYDFEESEETTNKETELSQLNVITKKLDEKIIIPERPFKNIGLTNSEQNHIQFQKPEEIPVEKSPNSSIKENDESVVSTTSYSDRDDFNYGSMTDNIDDDEADEKSNQGGQGEDDDDDDDDSSSDDSAVTSKTLGNKSLIMGRIFKKATTTTTVEDRKSTTTNLPISVDSQQKKKLPKQELDKLFDQLISDKKSENTGKNNELNKVSFDEITSVESASKKRGRPRKITTDLNKSEDLKGTTDTIQQKPKPNENKVEMTEKIEFIKPLPGKQSLKSTKDKLSMTKKTDIRQPITKEITKLQSELGMSAEEIAELIGEGKRKSQRRCAANSQKKHVEIWSSDEYEEFLTTKDIIALIEEKEKKIQKKKRDEKIQDQLPNKKLSTSKSVERLKQKQYHSDNILNNITEREYHERSKKEVENLTNNENILEKPQKLVKKLENFEAPLTKLTKKPSTKIVDKLLEKFTKSKTQLTKITNETTTSATEKLVNSKKTNIEKKLPNDNLKKPLPTLKPRLKARTSDSESDFETELKGRSVASAKIKKRRKTIASKDDLPPPPPVKRTHLGKPTISSNLNNKKPVDTKNNSQEIKTKLTKKTSGNGKCSTKTNAQSAKPLARRKRIASEMLYYWSSSSDEEFGRIEQHEDDEDDLTEDGERLQQHGWIVGDSHKKLVTLLAIAKGNKKVDDCGVKETNSKKKTI